MLAPELISNPHDSLLFVRLRSRAHNQMLFVVTVLVKVSASLKHNHEEFSPAPS